MVGVTARHGSSTYDVRRSFSVRGSSATTGSGPGALPRRRRDGPRSRPLRPDRRPVDHGGSLAGSDAGGGDESCSTALLPSRGRRCRAARSTTECRLGSPAAPRALPRAIGRCLGGRGLERPGARLLRRPLRGGSGAHQAQRPVAARRRRGGCRAGTVPSGDQPIGRRHSDQTCCSSSARWSRCSAWGWWLGAQT